MRVLLVDDNPVVLSSLSKTIPWEQAGCCLVGTASNGEEAMAFITKNRPDILLADIQMPGLGGLELVEKLQSQMSDPPLTIFITAYEDFHYAQTALRLGAFNYITKPIDNGELIQILRRAVAKLEQDAERQETMSRIVVENEIKTRMITKNRQQMIRQWILDCLNGSANIESLADQARHLGIDGPCFLAFLPGRFVCGGMWEKSQSVAKDLEGILRGCACLQIANGILFAVFINEGQNCGVILSRLKELMGLVGEEVPLFTKTVDSLSELRPAVDSIILRAVPETAGGDQRPSCLPPEIPWDTCPLILRKALSYIAENIDQRISLSDVAEKVLLSPNYLSALIKKETGLRFSDLTQTMKIDRAKRLLGDPTIRVYEIGELIGYEDYTTFYQSFKRATGLSPTTYRNMIENRQDQESNTLKNK